MAVQVLCNTLDRSFFINVQSALHTELFDAVTNRLGCPSIRIYSGTHELARSTSGSVDTVTVIEGHLYGGKGGFGANLKSAGKRGGAGTSNFGACRDLNGRRLRHVNDEIRLRKWASKDEREKRKIAGKNYSEPAGDHGVEGWFLGIPSWCEGFGKGKDRRRRQADHRREKAISEAEMARAERAAKKRAALQRYTTYEAPTADAMGAAIAAGMKAAVTAKRKRAALEHSADAAFLPVSVDGGASGMRWSARSWLQPLGDGESDLDIVPVDRTQNPISDEALDGTGEVAAMAVRGMAEFGTARVTGVASRGKVMYECTLGSDGLMQFGWATGAFASHSATGDGVGDHAASWSYDGFRQLKWNGPDAPYGDKWQAGDVVGCMCDIVAGTISFSRNGVDMGVAFMDIDFAELGGAVFPAVSLEAEESVLINIGLAPLQFPMPGYASFATASTFGGAASRQDEAIAAADAVNQAASDAAEVVPAPKKKAAVPAPATTVTAPAPAPASTPAPAPVRDWREIKLLDLTSYDSATALEAEGGDVLKDQLFARGLKCGYVIKRGTLAMRASRLWAVRDKQPAQIPNKFRAKNFAEVHAGAV